MSDLDLLALQELEHAARERGDGHFSVWRFTTNWKAALGTPVICTYGYIVGVPGLVPQETVCPFADDGRVPGFPTLTEAVEWALAAGPLEVTP